MTIADAVTVVGAIIGADRDQRCVAELASQSVDDMGIRSHISRAVASIRSLAETTSINAILGAVRSVASRSRETWEAVASSCRVVALSVARACLGASENLARASRPVGQTLANSRNGAVTMSRAISRAQGLAAVLPNPTRLASALSIGTGALVVALKGTIVLAPSLLTSSSIERLSAVAHTGHQAVSNLIALRWAVRNVAGLALPSSIAAAKSVHLTVSVVAAIILANTDAAVTSFPALLALASALNAVSVVAAQVHALKRGLGGRSSTIVASPTLSALAESRVNAASVSTALIKTDGLVARISMPSSKARTTREAIDQLALAVGARGANKLRAIKSSVVLVADAHAGLGALAVTRARVGTDRILACLTLESINASNNGVGHIARVELESHNQAVAVLHAWQGSLVYAAVSTLVAIGALALSGSNACSMSRAVVVALGLVAARSLPSSEACASVLLVAMAVDTLNGARGN